MVKQKCAWKKRACKRDRRFGSEFCELHATKLSICTYVDVTTKIACQLPVVAENTDYCDHHTELTKRQQLKYKEFIELRGKDKRVKDALEAKTFDLENSLFHNRQRYVDQVMSRDGSKAYINRDSYISRKELQEHCVNNKKEMEHAVDQLAENLKLRHITCAERLTKIADVKTPFQLANPESVNVAVETASAIELAKSVTPIPRVKKEKAKDLPGLTEIPHLTEFTDKDDPSNQCHFQFLTRMTPSAIVGEYDYAEDDETASKVIVDFLTFMVENDAVPKQAYRTNQCRKKHLPKRNYCFDHLYKDPTVCLKRCLMCPSTARIGIPLCARCLHAKIRELREVYLKDPLRIPAVRRRIAIGEMDDDLHQVFEEYNKVHVIPPVEDEVNSTAEAEAKGDVKPGDKAKEEDDDIIVIDETKKIEDKAEVEGDVKVGDAVVSDDSKAQSEAKVGDAVVGDGSKAGGDTKVEDAAIEGNAKGQVKDSAAGDNAKVEDAAKAESTAVDDSTKTEGAAAEDDVKAENNATEDKAKIEDVKVEDPAPMEVDKTKEAPAKTQDSPKGDNIGTLENVVTVVDDEMVDDNAQTGKLPGPPVNAPTDVDTDEDVDTLNCRNMDLQCHGVHTTDIEISGFPEVQPFGPNEPPPKKSFKMLMPRINMLEAQREVMKEEDYQRAKKMYNPLPDRKGLLKPTQRTFQLVNVAKDPSCKGAAMPSVSYLMVTQNDSALPKPESQPVIRQRKVLTNTQFTIFRPSTTTFQRWQGPRILRSVRPDGSAPPRRLLCSVDPSNGQMRPRFSAPVPFRPLSGGPTGSGESQNPEK